MMESNPVYHGDFIAQTKYELQYFNIILTESIKHKNDSYEPYTAHRLVISDWPTYNFSIFQKYTDEKLSSANPGIYALDLDELYCFANECIQKYGQLINQSTRVLRKLFLNYLPGIPGEAEIVNYPFFKETLFTYKFIEYYEKKNSLIHQEAENPVIAGLDTENKKDYYVDRSIIIEILGNALDNASNTFIDFLILNMLRYKYNYIPIVESYPIFQFKVSQNELSRRLGKIREELSLGPKSRRQLAELFSSIPQSVNFGVSEFLTQESLNRGMNKPKL